MRRHLVTAVLSVCAVIGLTAVACTPSTPTTPGTTSTTAPPVSFPAPTCGTYFAASGWPTTIRPAPGLFDCILTAFSAGTPASFGERYQTDGFGGHIEVRFFEVLAPGRVRLTIDATNTLVPAGVTVQVCSSLTPSATSGLVADGCTPD